jgi:hypothetical protein
MRSANIFSSAPDSDSVGVATRMVARQAGAGSLGDSVYDMQPGSKHADIHFRHSWVSNDSGSLARVLIVSTIAKGAEYSS